MENKKIAYCIPSLHSPGGMERVLTLKANYLVSQGCDVYIIITDGENCTPYYQLSKEVVVEQLSINFDNIYKHSLIYRYWLYKRKMRLLKQRLNECLCRIKPEITISMLRRDINIINQMNDGSIKIGEIHFDKGHYRAFNAKGLPAFLQRQIANQWMYSLVSELRKLVKFVVLTHEDAAHWKELENIVVIPNPVSFFPIESSECTTKKVIAAGRYVNQKGFDKLITAWYNVSEKHPDWTLHIYGDGWLRNKLQMQVDKLQLTHTCILEHTTPDIMSKYMDSSIFVLSSNYEGFGLVIVEAMSCGLPVVAFACPCGPRDIISENKDGFLVAPGDTTELANKIIQLIEDEEQRIEMGKAARKKAETYRIEQIGQQWIDLFNTLTPIKKD